MTCVIWAIPLVWPGARRTRRICGVHSKTLRELAMEIGADVVGDGDVVVSSVNTLQDARPGQLSFLANPKYEDDLEKTQASAVIVAASSKFDRVPTLRAKDPQLAYQRGV